MCDQYDALVTALTALEDIRFTQYEWATRPTDDFGTVQIDFEGAPDLGDGHKVDRALEGSVDLFLHALARAKVEEVVGVLTDVLGDSWHLNSVQYEHETGLLHMEWVFAVVMD